jgi:hypothetical protein
MTLFRSRGAVAVVIPWDGAAGSGSATPITRTPLAHVATYVYSGGDVHVAPREVHIGVNFTKGSH